MERIVLLSQGGTLVLLLCLTCTAVMSADEHMISVALHHA
jgi:hypothetical protein